MRLDILASILSLLAIYFIGQKKWWAWLFNIFNVPLMTVINVQNHLWGFHILNAVLAVLYIKNLISWYSKRSVCPKTN